MDLSSVVRYYVDRMLKEVPGMKVLLLDADTTRIVSTVYSQSEILEQEVYLVERLDADRRDQLFHLKVLALLNAEFPITSFTDASCSSQRPLPLETLACLHMVTWKHLAKCACCTLLVH